MGNSMGNAAASSMEGPLQQAQFSVVYSQVFFLGGFGDDNSKAKVGRLLEWQIESTDKNGTETFNASRALLSKEPDGSQWWYLAYRAKKDDLQYAVKLDKDFNPLLLRYRDQNTGAIKEVKYDQAEAQQGKDQMQGNQSSSTRSDGNAQVVNDPSEYAKLVKGQETITVGAGTFRTDKLVDTYTDPNDANKSYEYTWWVSKDVPGVVKYNWVNKQDGSTMKGELVKLQDGFTSPLMP
jgi:hypothetical protein